MQMTFSKNLMVLTTTFALTSMTYAETNVTFVDGFEAPLPYVKTECGFYDKKTKLTWSVKSYECPFFDASSVKVSALRKADVLCGAYAEAEFAKEKPNCRGRFPSSAQLITLRDLNRTPKSHIPEAKTDGFTIAEPSFLHPAVGLRCDIFECDQYCNAIDFKTGEFLEGIKEYSLSDKRYARLVITS